MLQGFLALGLSILMSSTYILLILSSLHQEAHRDIFEKISQEGK